VIIALRILGTEVFGFSDGSHTHLETDYRDTSEEVQV